VDLGDAEQRVHAHVHDRVDGEALLGHARAQFVECAAHQAHHDEVELLGDAAHLVAGTVTGLDLA